MKGIVNSLGFGSCVLLLMAISSFSVERKLNTSFSQEDIGQAIMSDRWDFAADYVTPSYGRSRSVATDGYFVKCRKDSLIAALPYFGKATSPAGGFGENPLQFQSTKNKIEKQEKKKGKWLVTVIPDETEAQSMNFTFFDNGTAQLSIIMKNRSSINFNGKISPAK